MIRTETIKKLNAVSLAISLMEESGVDVSYFEINDLPDDEVKAIAEMRETKLGYPHILKPYYNTSITKGTHRLVIRGILKTITANENNISSINP